MHEDFYSLVFRMTIEVKGIKMRAYNIKDGFSSLKKLLMIISTILTDKKILKVISNFFLEERSSFWFNFSLLSIEFTATNTKASIAHGVTSLFMKIKNPDISNSR